MGEDICKSDKVLVSKIYKELIQLNTTKTIQLKMGRRQEQAFLQRKHPGGQQTHEKILSIIHHQRNTNKNHNKIPPHTCQND